MFANDGSTGYEELSLFKLYTHILYLSKRTSKREQR